ncbi:MAG: VPLPA-CTERM sorting domain-containing protein [Paracoccaceae bacterium]
MNKLNKAVCFAVASVGMVAAPAFAAVVNGDFEDKTFSNPNPGLVNGIAIGDLETSGPGWDVYTDILGWETSAGSGIELQTNGTIGSFNANSGTRYVELDSHPAPNSNSTMFQTLVLDPGTYQLDFFYSPRNGDAGSNGIDYSVTGLISGFLLAGGVTGPSGTTTVGLWTLVSSFFTVQAGDSPVTLSFSAVGAENTLGGFIDDVSVSAVPVPAALPLLITALAGLGFLSRRRQRSAA